MIEVKLYIHNDVEYQLLGAFLAELDRQRLQTEEQEQAKSELTQNDHLAAAAQFVADNEVILTPPVTSSAVTTTLSPLVITTATAPLDVALPLVITTATAPLDVVPMMRAFASAKGLAAASAVLKEFGVPNVLSLSPEMHAAFAARVAL